MLATRLPAMLAQQLPRARLEEPDGLPI